MIDVVSGEVAVAFSVVCEPLGSRIKIVEPTATRTDPDQAFLILDYKGDGTVGWRVGISWFVFIRDKLVAIVAVEPVARSEPHEPPAVLHDASHIALGKTFACAEPVKFEER